MIRILAAVIALSLMPVSSAFAAGIFDYMSNKRSEVVMTETTYERYEHVKLQVIETVKPVISDCKPYVQGMWVNGNLITTNKMACSWVDGTIRDGRRGY